MGSCYWRHSPGAHFMALSICRCVPLCSRTLWKSLADISDFLSYRVRYLMRKDQSATALESGLDIPFSRLKQRPFVPLLSQVAYLSPLGNVANWMGSETVWASRKGRWLQLRDKSDAVLNSAANWKPIPWRLRDFNDGLSVKVITVDVLSFPCLGDDQRGAVWSPHLRHNPLGLSGDMLTTQPEGFLVMLMYMGFHPLECDMKLLSCSLQDPIVSLGRSREQCGRHGGQNTVLFISCSPGERKVFRPVLHFADSQYEHFKPGVDQPEVEKSKNTQTESCCCFWWILYEMGWSQRPMNNVFKEPIPDLRNAGASS